MPSNVSLQILEGVREYLLIKKKDFDIKGIVCATTGISIGSVTRKSDRCSDTFVKDCSKTQYDKNEEIKISGGNIKKSKYFLSRFALPVAPYIGKIPGWKSSTTLLFVANPKRSDKAKLEIIINLNKNLFPFAIPLIGKGSIRTIYSHPFTNYDTQYEIGVSILNIGLVTGSFKISLNCEPKNQFKTLILMPFQGQIVRFYQNIELTIEKESANTTSKNTNKKLLPSLCRIELLNEDEKTTQSKEIILEESKICICLVGCKCICDQPYTCEMIDKRTTTESPVKDFPHEKLWVIVCTILFLLMLLNLLKFSFGFCFPIPVGEAGLCVFITSSFQCEYLEKDLQQKAVEYDEDGYPVHPKTKERVRALQYKTMGALNLLFFFYLPFIVFHWFLARNKINKKKKDITWDKLETTVEMVKEGDDNFCLHRALKRASCQTISSDQSELPDPVQEERNSILEEYGRRIYKGKCGEESVKHPCEKSPKLSKDCQRKSKLKCVFNNFRKTEKEPSSCESSDCQKSITDNLSACIIPDITQTIRDGHESSSSEPSSCSSFKRTPKKDKCS
ncbi:Hypothetical predicted protein [Octopus vulgaris]|uniref:Generative cell specific-1/HAP2 domain-containing protein n=1 Tax=Octopus vulgaris TaxID=6645 RepID=A0AA36BBC4_OCTVU|nr:Hypothetical predicted protein [Octopus vulgaris]